MDEDKELESELRKYHSNFDLLEEVEKMMNDGVKKIKEKLLDENNSTPYDTNMETIRAWNLISFLSFILGDETEAFEYNSKVLELDMNNLIGLCNQAWFCLKRNENYSSVKGLCEQLKKTLPSTIDVLVAKAELAFCYSRFGIKRYEKAKMIFKEVLGVCTELQDKRSRCTSKEIEDSGQKLPNEYICVWTFRYALTFRRLLNINNVHDLSLDVSKQAHVTVCDLYCRIIGMSGQSQCLDRYKARSYVELGTLVFNARKNKYIFPNGVKDILPNHRKLWLEREEYFTRGIKICPNDAFTLERSGKIFRYINQIDESIEYLKRALEIRDTAFCHHHLALSLKRKLEIISSSPSSSVTDKKRQTVTRKLFERKETGDNSACTNQYGDGSMKFETNTTHFHSCKRTFSGKLDGKHFDTNSNLSLPNTGITGIRLQGLSQDVSTEQISSMLEHTSLDSAYETMPCTSSLLKSGHFDDASNISNQLHTTKDQATFYEQRYARGYGNKRLHQQRGCISTAANVPTGRHYHHSFSEPATNYPVRMKPPYTSRGRWRENKPWLRKEHSWAGHSTKDQRRPIINMIKSPQKPTHIDRVKHEETIAKIINHLDKSVEKSNNCGAIYDKGLLYRQIDQPEEAVETFKNLIRNKGGYCSLIQLSNAYEQAGLCLYDMLSTSAEDSESLECDMRQYFKKSIEISCNIVSKIPFLKDCWVSAPTLHGLLLGKAKTKENLKDLSFLFKKIEKYGEAIDVLNQLKKLTEDDTETVKINLELVENCLHLRNYDDAVLTLDMIMCLPNGFSIIDETLYLRVHIDGGVDALKNGASEMARLRFRNALDFSRCNKDGNENDDENDEQETDREGGEYDVLMLCNADIEDKIEELMLVMEEFTLRATLNFYHVVPGVTKLSGLCNLMRRSKHFLLVFDEKPVDKQMSYNFDMMQSVIFERGYGHSVILLIAQDVSVPTRLSHLPKTFMELNFDVEDVGTKCYNNENICEKMKDLLLKLARSK